MSDENKVEEDLVEENDCIVFSDEPKKQKVKVGASVYYLKEMMGLTLTKWQSFDAGRIKVVRNRIDMQPDAFKEYSATLINLCMVDEQDHPVPKSKIMSWPSSAITGLFDECQKMNGLNAEGRDEAKKA